MEFVQIINNIKDMYNLQHLYILVNSNPGGIRWFLDWDQQLLFSSGECIPVIKPNAIILFGFPEGNYFLRKKRGKKHVLQYARLSLQAGDKMRGMSSFIIDLSYFIEPIDCYT